MKEKQTLPPKTIIDAQLEVVLQKLTGGKSPEQIKAERDAGKWPFAVSADQMRADLEEMDLLIPTEDKKTDQG